MSIIISDNKYKFICDNMNKLKNTKLLKTQMIDYDLLENIADDFLIKKYGLGLINIFDDSLINFSAMEFENSILLSAIMDNHINHDKQSLIIFYIKKYNKAFCFIKSYQLIDYNNITLPYIKTYFPISMLSNYNDEIKGLLNNEVLIIY